MMRIIYVRDDHQRWNEIEMCRLREDIYMELHLMRIARFLVNHQGRYLMQICYFM